jgi:M3 family oligoendopeptidase
MLQQSTSEVNEIHSMSMEYFAFPWMESFFGDKASDYVIGHLIGGLAVLPYMCCVDEFQHRVYERPDMDAKERRRIWREIEKAYMPWRDYDSEPFLEEGGFWMQKQHIFIVPFYYIDYALAQMGAFHFYVLSRKDPEKAWKDYLRLLRAGGTKGYFELLALAGIPNPFEDGTVEKCAGPVIREVLEAYKA